MLPLADVNKDVSTPDRTKTKRLVYKSRVDESSTLFAIRKEAWVTQRQLHHEKAYSSMVDGSGKLHPQSSLLA